MIELRQLRTFVTVCQNLTLTEAALSLDIAVSTLSAGLKTLEREIGTLLFERSTAGFYPTPAARWLYRLACGVLTAEAFGRRLMRAPKRATCNLLSVDIRSDFAFGRLTIALGRALEAMANSDPLTMIDVRWIGEPGADSATHLPNDLLTGRPGRVVIEQRGEADDAGDRETILLRDHWAIGCRLPAGTMRPPQSRQFFSGHDLSVVVPALQNSLIDQVRNHLRDFDLQGVRFSTDHPAALPSLFKDNPDTAALAPEGLLSPQLGLPHVVTIPLSPPLKATIVARIEQSCAAANSFVRCLRRALRESRSARRQPTVLGTKTIHYFNILYRTRGVALAAQAANMTQPAMTEQLHQLEDTLNVRLFDRRSDGLIPTTDGDRFAFVAEAIARGLRAMTASGGSAQRLTVESLRLGILPSVSQHGYLVNKVADAVLAVRVRHPLTKLVVMEGPTETLQGWVTKGFVEVAIVETGLPNMPRLPLGASEPLAAIAHPRHALLPQGPVSLAALATVPLALPRSPSGLRQILDAAARKQGLSIVPRVEIDGLAMLIAVLNREQMCAILPASAVKQEIDRGELIAHPIVDPEIARTLYVIYSANRSLTEPERDLVRTLRKGLSSPDAGG